MGFQISSCEFIFSTDNADEHQTAFSKEELGEITLLSS